MAPVFGFQTLMISCARVGSAVFGCGRLQYWPTRNVPSPIGLRMNPSCSASSAGSAGSVWADSVHAVAREGSGDGDDSTGDPTGLGDASGGEDAPCALVSQITLPSGPSSANSTPSGSTNARVAVRSPCHVGSADVSPAGVRAVQ